MSGKGTLVVGGNALEITDIELSDGCVKITAYDRPGSEYCIEPDDHYTVVGRDGRGVAQGDMALPSGRLCKQAEYALNITVAFRADTITTGTRFVDYG